MSSESKPFESDPSFNSLQAQEQFNTFIKLIDKVTTSIDALTKTYTSKSGYGGFNNNTNKNNIIKNIENIFNDDNAHHFINIPFNTCANLYKSIMALELMLNVTLKKVGNEYKIAKKSAATSLLLLKACKESQMFQNFIESGAQAHCFESVFELNMKIKKAKHAANTSQENAQILNQVKEAIAENATTEGKSSALFALITANPLLSSDSSIKKALNTYIAAQNNAARISSLLISTSTEEFNQYLIATRKLSIIIDDIINIELEIQQLEQESDDEVKVDELKTSESNTLNSIPFYQRSKTINDSASIAFKEHQLKIQINKKTPLFSELQKQSNQISDLPIHMSLCSLDSEIQNQLNKENTVLEDILIEQQSVPQQATTETIEAIRNLKIVERNFESAQRFNIAAQDSTINADSQTNSEAKSSETTDSPAPVIIENDDEIVSLLELLSQAPKSEVKKKSQWDFDAFPSIQEQDLEDYWQKVKPHFSSGVILSNKFKGLVLKLHHDVCKKSRSLTATYNRLIKNNKVKNYKEMCELRMRWLNLCQPLTFYVREKHGEDITPFNRVKAYSQNDPKN